MKTRLRCVLRLHRWRNKWNDEGQRYELCDRCGAYRDKPHLMDTARVE